VRSKYIIPLIFALGAVLFRNYLVRWISALLTAMILFAYSLEGWEPKLPNISFRTSMKDEIERLARIVKRANTSPISRKIILEHVRDIYNILGLEFREDEFRWEGDSIRDLERILTKVEEDINGRSKESTNGYRGS